MLLKKKYALTAAAVGAIALGSFAVGALAVGDPGNSHALHSPFINLQGQAEVTGDRGTNGWTHESQRTPGEGRPPTSANSVASSVWVRKSGS